MAYTTTLERYKVTLAKKARAVPPKTRNGSGLLRGTGDTGGAPSNVLIATGGGAPSMGQGTSRGIEHGVPFLVERGAFSIWRNCQSAS